MVEIQRRCYICLALLFLLGYDDVAGFTGMNRHRHSPRGVPPLLVWSSRSTQELSWSSGETFNSYDSKATSKDRQCIRIRKSVQSDLPIVAELLSTAASSLQSNKNNNKSNWGLGNWKARLDQRLAQAEIESLLRCRLEAMEEGRKAYHKLAHHMVSLKEEQDRLKLLWSNSDRLRNHIEKASAETGEDNVWRRHNFALTPLDSTWLHHLQMTAEDVSSGQVVGFCEVAMLSNPILLEQQQTTTTTNGDDKDDIQDTFNVFSPAIVNLATSPERRRQGIATRMLRLAERFVERKWGSTQLGLYVEKANHPALALYMNSGYEAKVSCANRGDNHLGELWYMTKSLYQTPSTYYEVTVGGQELMTLSGAGATRG